MMTKLKRLIGSPVFDDAQKTQDAYLLNFVTLSYLAFLTLAVLSSTIVAPDIAASEIIIQLTQRLGILFLSNLFAQIFLRLGRVRLGSYVYVIGMTLGFVFLILFNGGVSAIAFSNSIMIIIAAGLIIGARAAFATTATITLAAFIALILEAREMLPEPLTISTSAVNWMSISFILLISTIMIALFIKGRNEASAAAEEANARLKEAGELLEQRVQERTQELALAAEIGRNVSQIRDLNKLTTTAVSLIQQRFNLYHAQLYLANAEQTKLTLFSGTGTAGKQMLASGQSLPIDSHSLNGRAASEKQAILVSDTAKSSNFKPNPLLPQTRSETAVPLIVGDTVVGVLDLQSDQPHAFTDDNLPAFVILAGQLAVAIENSNLFTKATHQAERLTALNEMSAAIATTTDINEIYKVAGKYTQKIVGGLRASLGILDPDGQTFEVLGLSGEKGAIPMNTHLPVSKTAVGLCIRESRLLINADGQPENYADAKQLAEQGLISVMNAPIVVSGKTIGAINIASNQANAFGTQEGTLMHQISSLLSGAIENRQLLTQTQEALQETNIFRQLVENAGQGIGMATLEGNILYINPMLTNMLTLDAAEEIAGEPLFQYYSEEVQAKFQQEIMPTLIQEGNWTGEVGMTINSTYLPTHENYFLLYDNTGEPFQLGAILTDISSIKESEAVILKQTEDLQTVADISNTIASTLDTSQLLQNVVEFTKSSFNLYHAHIYLRDEETDTLKLTVGAGDIGAKMVTTGHSIPYEATSLVAQAARAKQGVIVNNVATDPDFLPNDLLPDTQSEMAVPMMVGNKVIGVLDVQATTINHFSSADMNILTTLAAQIAVSLETARAFEQANEQASIIQSTPNIIATATMDGKLRFMNKAGLQRLGYDSLDEVLGQPLSIFYPPDHDMGRRKEIGKAIQQHGIWQGENRIITKSGEIFPVEQIITFIRDEQGKPKLSAVNMSDITARKQSEEAIRRNETLMRTIIDSTPDWIFVKDAQHRYQMVNKAYAETTDFEPEELIGKTILDIGLPQEIAETLLAEDNALMESGETIVVAEEELLIDGKARYQTLTKVLLRDESGQVQNMVGYAHDVTNQVLAAEEQTQLQQELEAQLERVNALQRAMTREGWQAFMTTTAGKRPFQGFAFNQEGIKTLTSQDLTNGKNKKTSSAAANGDNELITPVKIQDTTIGKLGVRNPDGTPISEEKRTLLISLTTQVAEALDRARLFEETELGRQEIEAQAAELSTVNEISELVSTQLNINDLVNAVGDRLIETFSANSVYIALVDEKTRVINFPYFTNMVDGPLNLPPRTLDDKGGFTAKIYTNKQPVIHNYDNEDIETAAKAAGAAVVDSSQESDSYIGVPMMVGEAVIGVIGINGQQDRRKYDEEDLPLLTILASTIAVAVQNAQQFEATQRRANREALVNEITQKIQRTQTVETALEIAANELGQIFQSPYVAVEINLANQQKQISNKE